MFRRYSLTGSNESALSSTSSISDIWAGSQALENKSVWGGDPGDISLGLCVSPGIDSVYCHRRGSDSEAFGQKHQAIAESRRDSDLVSWHESRRRSSGYVSDTCRRDSTASNPSVSPAPNIPPVVPENVAPGMEDVPQWLKHLRLHKYSEFIMGLTYQELLQLNEEKLVAMNVTKGARKKILLSIEKLSERPDSLRAINGKLEIEGCDVKEILVEIEGIARSPILVEDLEFNARSHHGNSSATDSGAEVSDDEEKAQENKLEEVAAIDGNKLCDMIMKTLKKTTSVILLSQHIDSKLVSQLTQTLDICLSRSCFNSSQKQQVISWKQKILALWGHVPVIPSQGKAVQRSLIDNQ